jgi:WD40 repeat protein
MAFSPDVVILATAAEGGAIRLWRVSDGALLDTFPTDLTIRVMSFSPDGTTLVAVSNESVSAWRVSDWSILRRLAGPKEAVANVAFSPDGALLAATSSASIFLWRVADGVLLRSFTEHGDTVKSVTFSPDGKILASGSQDRTIQLWQLR